MISGKSRVVGVWGWPVTHSRSPQMQNAALAALGLDWVYVPFAVAPDQLGQAVQGLRALGMVGVNVTVPHKAAVIQHLDWVEDEAARIGSVNTIWNDDGVLRGYSTDGPGLLKALEAEGEAVEGRRVLLLGAGGSARAVAFALAGRGAQIWIANRTREKADALCALVNRDFDGWAAVLEDGQDAPPCDLVINTTSLGMTPHEDALPALPPGTFDGLPFVYDLIYSPPETRLLRTARQAGCRKANGLGMLAAQGALSLARWTGLPWERLPLGAMAAALEKPPK